MVFSVLVIPAVVAFFFTQRFSRALWVAYGVGTAAIVLGLFISFTLDWATGPVLVCSFGLFLLLALGAGHLVKYVKIPEVTGYIVAGVVLGPSMLGWVSTRNLAALEILSEVALGLILFSVGTVFEASRFRRVGQQVLLLTLYESALAALLVTGGQVQIVALGHAAFLSAALAASSAALQVA